MATENSTVMVLTGYIDSDVPVATDVSMRASDVKSRLSRPDPAAPDWEGPRQAVAAAAAEGQAEDGARRGLGIALICTILASCFPGASDNIIPIVLAYFLSCGCCMPRVNTLATATLVTLCLVNIIQTIINKAVAALFRDMPEDTILIPGGVYILDVIEFALAYATWDRCCAANYSVEPHVKKWARATLVTVCLMTITDKIFVIMVLNIAGEESEAIRHETLDANMAYLAPVCYSRYFLYVLALAFSALFTFGSGWLRRSASFWLNTCLVLCLLMLFQ